MQYLLEFFDTYPVLYKKKPKKTKNKTITKLFNLSLSLTPKSLPFIGDKQMLPQFLKIKGKTRY